MSTSEAHLTVYNPACYRIRARGTLDARWSSWMQEMQLAVEPDAGAPVLTLRGTLRDQAALMGVLNQLSQLGLPLISVELLAVDVGAHAGEAPQCPRPSM